MFGSNGRAVSEGHTNTYTASTNNNNNLKRKQSQSQPQSNANGNSNSNGEVGDATISRDGNNGNNGNNGTGTGSSVSAEEQDHPLSMPKKGSTSTLSDNAENVALQPTRKTAKYVYAFMLLLIISYALHDYFYISMPWLSNIPSSGA